MLKNKIQFIILISILTLFPISEIIAQANISSPYSAFGLGNLSDVNNMRIRSMGGIAIGTRDYFTVNVTNPASYSAFDSTSFIFEAGAYGHYTILKTDDINEEIASASLSHILMGFPITKWWRTSVGLMPFSQVGYDVNDHKVLENIGNTQYIFEGSGGISKFNWGNSVQPFKNFSMGLNASYLFGTVDRVGKVTFPDSVNMISTMANNTLTINDVDFEFGVQYHTQVKDIYKIVIGATYHPEQNLKTHQNSMVRSYKGTVGTQELILDTISITDNEFGSITFPQTFGFGFTIARSYKWMVGADYKFEEWSQFKAYNLYDSLSNRQIFRLGGNFVPDRNSSNYINRVDFRLGGHYNISYLYLREEQLNGFGITFGLGLPVSRNGIRGTRSMINLGFELGKVGTTNKNLIQENYYNFYLSVSIFERWFIKRRYR